MPSSDIDGTCPDFFALYKDLIKAGFESYNDIFSPGLFLDTAVQMLSSLSAKSSHVARDGATDTEQGVLNGLFETIILLVSTRPDLGQNLRRCGIVNDLLHKHVLRIPTREDPRLPICRTTSARKLGFALLAKLA